MKQDAKTAGAAPKHTRRKRPIDIENAKLPPELARSRYGKYRALALILVYVLMIIHITHWKVSGRTMAPLELSEIMKALELGVISPGVIFIGVMLVGSAIFGRFFCSWACHMLALQDLFHWIFKKLRIRPLAIRSRLLLLVPFGTAFYMFFWPQVNRMWQGRDLPDASARLVTTDFWRDLPGPLVIALTVLCCGLLIVYLYGGRGFCTYGCPYGILFGFMDRIAPGKIRARPGCEQCARCTAICTSNIRVHEETKAYGMVVNPRCMKDLDCVSVCPHQVLHYGFGRPTIGNPRALAGYGFAIWEELALVVAFASALFAFWRWEVALPVWVVIVLSAIVAFVAIFSVRMLRRRTSPDHRPERQQVRRYDFSIAEEILMAAVFLVAILLTWRGLYDRLPFLMSIALSAATAYVAVTFVRLFHRVELDLNRYRLKAGGKLTRAGRIFVTVSTLFLILFLHSSFIQYHRRRGGACYAAAESAQFSGAEAERLRRAAWERGIEHLQLCDRWGLTSTTNLEYQLGTLTLNLDRLEEAETYLKRAVKRSPNFPDARINLAKVLEKRGEIREAAEHLAYALEIYSPHEEYQPRYRHLYAKAHVSLGGLLVGSAQKQGDPTLRQQQLERAEHRYRAALELEADNSDAYFGLGCLAAARGPAGFPDAIEFYRTAIDLNPQAAEAHANLGDVHVALNRVESAIDHYRQALAIDPNIEKVHYKIGFLNLTSDNLPDALEHLAAAVGQQPDDAEAHHHYGQALQRAGRLDEARHHFERAQALVGDG